MSKVKTHAICTKFDDSFCAHKNSPSSSEWGSKVTHDKNRGRVVAFARLISTSLHILFTTSCTQSCSRKMLADHQFKITKYLQPRINLFDLYLRIVRRNLDIVESHVHWLSICDRFTPSKYRRCAITDITVLNQPN